MKCDANVGNHRYEAYCDGQYIGAADTEDDCREYAGCCDGEFTVIDTEEIEATGRETNEVAIGREKAIAILGDEYIEGVDYYIRVINGQEKLYAWGDNDVCAVNRTNTSWLSPGYPPEPDADDDENEDGDNS